MTKFANRIAARILDAIIARIPQAPPMNTSETAPAISKYTIEDYTDGSPYLTRVLFPRIPFIGWRPMLHKFHRPDGDRALHNHPWRAAFSIVLAGSYVEERLLPDEAQLYRAAGLELTPAIETRHVRWWNYLTDADFHRITELRGSVYTLFVIGERIQTWGFLDAFGVVTPWREYIDARIAEIAGRLK